MKNFIEDFVNRLDITAVLHMLVSYLVMTFAACINLYFGMIFAFGLGVFKEVWDKAHGGRFDWNDIAADFLGITLGVLQVSLYSSSVGIVL